MKVRLLREGDSRRSFYVDVCQEHGWDVTTGDDWDLCWDLDPPARARFAAAKAGQRYSHVWGVGELSIKSRLDQNLVAHRHLLGERGEQLYDFFPRSFMMPDDHDELVAAAAEEPGALWIQKPKWLSRGRGVELVKDLDHVPRGPEWMVQEYLAWPHLLDERKYSLRFYVLIASLDPLVVFVHEDGFCKFASRPFRLDAEGLADRFAHLTNPDVLRDDPTTPVSGRNLTHAQYRQRLRDAGHDDARLFREIHRILALTVIAARGQIVRRHRKDGLDWRRGFEILGVDVLVDDALLPWLLECNLLPSLEVEADPQTDAARDEHAVKHRVVADLFGYFALGARHDVAQHGGFQRVLPSAELSGLLSAYSMPFAADLRLWQAEHGTPPPHVEIVPDAIDLVADDGATLQLRDRATGHAYFLTGDEAASWRAIGAGTDLVALTAALPGQDADALIDRVAMWIDAGMLRRRETPDLQTT